MAGNHPFDAAGTFDGRDPFAEEEKKDQGLAEVEEFERGLEKKDVKKRVAYIFELASTHIRTPFFSSFRRPHWAACAKQSR